jgi:hypothetical protein
MRYRRFVRDSSAATLRGVALALATPLLASAQSPNAPASYVPLLAWAGGISAADQSAVDRGESVVLPLHTTDRDEVAVIGVVAIDVPTNSYVNLARQLRELPGGPTRTAAHVLSDPPVLSDFAALSMDREDAANAARCEPLHCALKLPSGLMSAISGSAASSPAGPRTDALFKQWLLQLVSQYRERGDAALPVYDDTRPEERSMDGARQLLAEDQPFVASAPALASSLSGPSSVPGVTSTFFWCIEQHEKLKPVISVMQRSTALPATAHDPTFIATKQLYANHYFDAFLDVAAVTERSDDEPGTYVVLVRRVRFDKVPKRRFFDVRGRLSRQLADALREELALSKRTVEAAYAGHAR